MTFSCVYKITYSGNKLPPYYIGSTYLDKIEEGYLGTPTSLKYKESWKEETKKNPQLFKIEILSIHSIREEAAEFEEIEQRASFTLPDPLWVNQSYANRGFIGSSLTATKAAETRKKKNIGKSAAILGHKTRKKNGTDITGCKKGVETKKKKGIPPGATKESAAKRKQTLLKNNKTPGFTKESHALGMQTKKEKGIFKDAGIKTSKTLKKSAERNIVFQLKILQEYLNITLGKGWCQRSNEWIENKIRELSSLIFE